MRSIFILLASLFVSLATAGELTFSVLTPPAYSAGGDSVEIGLVALNSGPGDLPLNLPRTLPGALKFPGWNHATEFTTVEPLPANIEPGRFAVVHYRAALPAETRGPLTVVFSPPAGPQLQLVMEEGATAPVAAVAPPASEAAPVHQPLVPSNAGSAFNRLFAERFNPHQPVYFIYGPDDPVAKLQFSLKYRLLDFDGRGDQAPLQTLQFGYTQRSLWDINGNSSPFYDTSYMPELFFEAVAAPVENPTGFYHGLGLQTGFLHESNGRDDTDSRSLNQVFLRTFFLLGSIESWHAVIAPEVFLYVGGMDDNPRLKDYRGYGRLSIALGRGDGPSLTTAAYCGKDFNHPSVQLDLAIPLRFALLDFKTFFLVQYFNGYGESLRDYEKHSQTVRAGMALVR